MPWNAKPVDENYALQGILSVNINPINRMVSSFMIPVGKKYTILRIIEHLIHDLDNPEFVTIVFPTEKEKNKEEVLYGAKPKEINFYVQLSVHKDDVDRINDKESIRILCNTNAFPEKKEAFIEFFEELHAILRW